MIISKFKTTEDKSSEDGSAKLPLRIGGQQINRQKTCTVPQILNNEASTLEFKCSSGAILFKNNG